MGITRQHNFGQRNKAYIIPVITTALLIESCYSSFYRFHSLIKNEL